MSTTWAKPLPTDRNGAAMQNYPAPASTLGSIARENASASSVTSLDANATVLEIAAVGAPAVLRWAVNQATSVVSAASGANFDHIIAPEQVRRFVIPRKQQAIPNYSSIDSPSVVGLNTAEGLFDAVATKSAGTGSVLLAQY